MARALTWTEMPDADYDRAYGATRRAPLLQCRAYAEAVCPPQGQRARRYRIAADGTAVGIAQVQEARLLLGAVHAVILDRGPLGCADGAAVLDSFAARWPRRAGRRRRVICEAPLTRAPAGLDQVPGQRGYQTIWVDLTPEEAVLRQRLKGSWRRDLAKAGEQAVHADWLGDDLGWLLDRDAASGHPGPGRATLMALARRFLPEGRMLILRVGPDTAPLAGALFLLHGQSATYQVGWVGAAGRRAFAGHLCLWRGLLELKARGIADLDLGGVNDADAAGVKRFKQGLGGHPVTLPPQFR